MKHPFNDPDNLYPLSTSNPITDLSSQPVYFTTADDLKFMASQPSMVLMGGHLCFRLGRGDFFFWCLTTAMNMIKKKQQRKEKIREGTNPLLGAGAIPMSGTPVLEVHVCYTLFRV